MYYVVDYEICAAIFMLLLIILTALKKGIGDYQSRIYQAYFALSFVNLCLDVITSYTITYFESVPLWLNYLLNSIFFTGQFIIPTLLMVYVHMNVAKVRQVNLLMWLWAFLPPAIGVMLVLLNAWTEHIFYFNETGYHKGVWHSYLYVNAASCVIGTILYMICARKYLKRRQQFMIIALVVVSMFPTVIQYFFPNYLLTGVGTALSVFMIYMSNENMTEYVDQTTGALNREALMFHMTESRNKKMLEQVFVIALDNFKIINEKYGIEGGNRLMQMIVDTLQEIYSSSAVYRFGGDNFVVVIEEKTEGAKELDRIRKTIGRKWILDSEIVEISLSW